MSKSKSKNKSKKSNSQKYDIGNNQSVDNYGSTKKITIEGDYENTPEVQEMVEKYKSEHPEENVVSFVEVNSKPVRVIQTKEIYTMEGYKGKVCEELLFLTKKLSVTGSIETMAEIVNQISKVIIVHGFDLMEIEKIKDQKMQQEGLKEVMILEN